jgi:hypothetical protein
MAGVSRRPHGFFSILAPSLLMTLKVELAYCREDNFSAGLNKLKRRPKYEVILASE